jgi:RNA polymerase sigma-70 factor (ECF subfamily)
MASVEVPSLSQLFERIYDRLHELSSMHMRGQPAGHTLQPTAVVHEAFLKLAHRESSEFASEEHFAATAALILRNVLVDHARRRSSAKRGRGRRGMDLETFEPSKPDDVAGVLELEDALAALTRADDRSAQVASLRIFGAMEMAQIGRVIGVSVPTVERDWRFARAFLERQYRGLPAESQPEARVE